MKNFSLYLKDVSSGTHGKNLTGKNINVNAPGMHRKVTQYKRQDLRKGVYQPARMRFRKNRLYTPMRYVHKISNKIREEKLSFSFKAFLNEAHLDTHGKVKLFSTYHSKEQGEKRAAEDSIVKDIFHKFAEHLQTKNYGDKHKFVVTSKKHNRTVCFDHRKDKFATNDSRKHLIATTVFPEGDKYCNKESTPVKVESFEEEYIIIEIDGDE